MPVERESGPMNAPPKLTMSALPLISGAGRRGRGQDGVGAGYYGYFANPGNALLATHAPSAFFSPYALLVALGAKLTGTGPVHALAATRATSGKYRPRSTTSPGTGSWPAAST